MLPAMERRARTEMQINPRYRWLGEKPRWKTLQQLTRCRLLILTSKMEGGANVVSEAIAASVPIVCTRVSGCIGLLGEGYPGYFDVGDTRGLTRLLTRVETDGDFYRKLQSWCCRLKPLFDPKRECTAWKELLCELTDHSQLCWSSDFCAAPMVPNMASILGEFRIFPASSRNISSRT